MPIYIGQLAVPTSNEETPATMPEEQFYSWFSGLTSGEGTFFARIRSTKAGKPNVNCEFKITLRIDDKPMLDAISHRLGVGNVYTAIPTQPGANQTASYRVTDMGQLVGTIIPVFEKYPLASKKSRDFETWKQILKLSSTRMDQQKMKQVAHLVWKLRADRYEGLPPKSDGSTDTMEGTAHPAAPAAPNTSPTNLTTRPQGII